MSLRDFGKVLCSGVCVLYRKGDSTFRANALASFLPLVLLLKFRSLGDVRSPFHQFQDVVGVST